MGCCSSNEVDNTAAAPTLELSRHEGSKSDESSADSWRDSFPFESNIFALNDSYIFKKRIHTNKDAIVYKAVDRVTNQTVAVKIAMGFRPGEDPREVRVMRLLQGYPFTQQFITWKPFPKTRCFAIVSAFVESDGTKNFTVPQIVAYIHDVLLALKVVHAAGVVYRDIKPSNIIVDRTTRRAVVIDYDCAVFYDNSTFLHRLVGTDGYMAPEVEQMSKAYRMNKDIGRGYGFPVDVFSAGIVLGEMLFALEDKGNTTIAILEQRLQRVKPKLPIHDLLKAMINPDPGKRIGIQPALDHACFAGMEDDSVIRPPPSVTPLPTPPVRPPQPPAPPALPPDSPLEDHPVAGAGVAKLEDIVVEDFEVPGATSQEKHV